MSELRQRYSTTSKNKDNSTSSNEDTTKSKIMENTRIEDKYLDCKVANSSIAEDILSPLLTTSMTTDKDEVPKAGKIRHRSDSKREISKLGLFSSMGLAIVSFQVFCEVSKQIANYSLQYYNGGHFPIPQTVMVITIELVKLFATVSLAKGKHPISSQGFSWTTFRASSRFLIPSILYAINNNIYFYGLTLVAPPIWIILCSFRTIVTASMYKFYLQRQVSRRQFVGCFFIVISLVVAKLPDLLQLLSRDGKDSSVIKIVAEMSTENSTKENPTVPLVKIQDNNVSDPTSINALPITAILLAMVASCNSVGAALYTESLYKSNSVKGETFLDQQFWIYFYGTIVATIVHAVTNPSYQFMSLSIDLLRMRVDLQMILFIAIMCGSVGGMVVASILKLLDNIVKEYSGSTANILTAVLCAGLFPDKFELTVYIMLSMTCLLTGIYLYESNKMQTSPPASKENKNMSNKS